jgi:hypothetical protein
MKKAMFLILAAMLIAGFAGNTPANAGTIWATDAIWSAGSGVGTIGSDRYRLSDALGAPDPATNSVDFLALGLAGYAIFDFGQLFDNQAMVVETTYGNRQGYPEKAEILVAGENFTSIFENYKTDPVGSQNAPTDMFASVGYIDNSQMTSTVDLSGQNGPFRYLMVKDTTSGGQSFDGFDIDAVGVAPVPEPGTVVLLGLGLIGLAGARRKMKK